ncbi:MAG TPA: alpha/beta fold hydrolase [Noviherbaspirillum sp.]|uniref:alpha/beta fold hydrolase n=1 Tax=Noviherbaspirillum sp. TaxID=1926288 RepID=UPI002D5935D4|nr:alpha/beta fold hydrolase [Noviherbaspirillum sp.]HYD97126.1 alpha/beta fold hydrolase [Noviherbaspirillum sp.]
MQTLTSGIRWWFESLDRARRRRGNALDHLGYGPIESEYRTALVVPGMRLRFYGGDPHGGPIALIVPAPIKRHYIWDLAPECSVVQHLLRTGVQVYLAEWTEPADSRNGLEHYSHTLLDHCVKAIRTTHREGQLFLLSHSLGGVFATIYAALYPDEVAGLVLLETPLHFDEASGSFGPLVASSPPADKLTEGFDQVPGSVLSIASTIASPATFQVERYTDFVASLCSSRTLRSHLLVERWALDEAPMAARLFEQVVEDLYRSDSLMRGTLEVSGQRLSPKSLTTPLLSVYDPHSVVIPPASVIAFHDAAASKDKRLIPNSGDTGVALAHVAALMGENAHRLLWPAIIEWMTAAGARRH